MKPSKFLLCLNLAGFAASLFFFILGRNIFRIEGLEINIGYWSEIFRWTLMILTFGVVGFIAYRMIERVIGREREGFAKDMGIAIACLIILLFSYGIVALTG